MSALIYSGDENFNARKLIRRIVYFKCCSTGSQWRLFKTGVICAHFLVLVTRRAAAFWTRCNFCSWPFGRPYSNAYIMIWGTYYHKFGQNIKIFKILCTKYMESSEGMTSSTRSFAYSYRLVKKCFLKICETSKCHNFLIFQPIFIRFSLFCSENFTLSSEIKLEQLRTSPLSMAC